MPSLPKSRKRPWLPERTKAPHSGRKIKNPFYQTMPWRRFRERQKQIAIEKTKEIMQQFVAQKKPIPEAVMSLQPLCEECLNGNPLTGPKYTIARVLDHIKPINPKNPYDTQFGRYGEPLDEKNTQWLCDYHHAKKSGAEHRFHKQK